MELCSASYVATPLEDRDRKRKRSGSSSGSGSSSSSYDDAVGHIEAIEHETVFLAGRCKDIHISIDRVTYNIFPYRFGNKAVRNWNIREGLPVSG